MTFAQESQEIASVFDAVVAALNTGDFLAAARRCDPISLRSVQRDLLHTLRQQPPTFTVEDVQRSAPDMPRAVAEYQVESARQRVADGSPLAALLPECPSVAAAEGAAPDRLFAWWLEGRRPYHQIRQLETRGLAPPGAAELSKPHLPGLGLVVVRLGVVPDGLTVAHVLYREDEGDPATWPPEATGWFTALPPDEAAFALDRTLRGAVRTVMSRRQPDDTWALVAGLDFLSVGHRFITRVEHQEPTTGETA